MSVSTSHVPEAVRERVRTWSRERCCYCRAPRRLVLGQLEVEHIHPHSLGGTSDELNLCLACRLCNGFKSNQTVGHDPVSGEAVALFHPRRQMWDDHFAWSDNGLRILGRSPCGRATVVALRLNNDHAIEVRTEWAKVGLVPFTE